MTLTDEERRERSRVSTAKLRAANPEKFNARQRAYRAANPDKVKAQGRASRARRVAANPEKFREQAHADYVRRRDVDPEKAREKTLKNAAYWRAIQQRRSDAAMAKGCFDCGAPAEHLHHLVPSRKLFNLNRGAYHGEKAYYAELAKCVPLCQPCHARRHRWIARCEPQTLALRELLGFAA